MSTPRPESTRGQSTSILESLTDPGSSIDKVRVVVVFVVVRVVVLVSVTVVVVLVSVVVVVVLVRVVVVKVVVIGLPLSSHSMTRPPLAARSARYGSQKTRG